MLVKKACLMHLIFVLKLIEAKNQNLIMKIEFGKPFIDREERLLRKTLRQPVLV